MGSGSDISGGGESVWLVAGRSGDASPARGKEEPGLKHQKQRIRGRRLREAFGKSIIFRNAFSPFRTIVKQT